MGFSDFNASEGFAFEAQSFLDGFPLIRGTGCPFWGSP